MACCCTNTLELCKVSVCGSAEIVTGMTVTEPGNYRLELNYLGVTVNINKTFEADEELNFPAANLNEDYKYTGKVYGPDGDPFPIVIEEVSYDCIAFQTVLSYNLVEEEVVEEP